MSQWLWHPIFVHFTVALLFLAPVLFLLGAAAPKKRWSHSVLFAARWHLWAGMAFAVGTVATGFLAYATVPHVGPAHPFMIEHRNWALSAAAVYSVLAAWQYALFRSARMTSAAFLVVSVVGLGLLARTGYLGGELVFTHGAGVAQIEAAGDDGHEHGDDHQH